MITGFVTTLVLVTCAPAAPDQPQCEIRSVSVWQSDDRAGAVADVADCLKLGAALLPDQPWRCESPQFKESYSTSVSANPADYP